MGKVAGRLGTFAVALLLLGGCGSGAGGLASGPTGNGPPPDNQQQPPSAHLTSLCQSFCQLDVQCPNSNFQDVATCMSECQTGLQTPVCKSELVGLLECVSKLTSCDTTPCASQTAAVVNCEKSLGAFCSAGQCDTCPDACSTCKCQHPNDATQCTAQCSATPGG